jgi:trans-aconitate methyltransferase
MERQLEPELMEDADQVKAYAEADFEIPHNQFIERLKDFVDQPHFSGTALDLGCGPGDISIRFARAFPFSNVDAVDGSKAMIDYANTLPDAVRQRISFIHGRLPFVTLPQTNYEIIFSNSLLHHLPDPYILWQSIKTYAKPGTHIAVMDLLRPDSIEEAQTMVDTYAADEPEILRCDFYYSLLAAFTLEEIGSQLMEAGLNMSIVQISDRHVFIKGIAA